MHRKARKRNKNRAAEGPVLKVRRTAQNIGADLLGLACRLLIVTLGLGSGLGIAAIFDIDA